MFEMEEQPEERPEEGSIEEIPLEMLFVDERYQRPLNALRIKRIAEDFDPKLVGTLIVSWRENGMMAILDGQHRYHALRRLKIKRVRCLVYDGLAPEQEATLFYKLNSERTQVAAEYDFVARCFARDPDIITIVDTVHACGLKLREPRLDGASADALHCFRTLENVYLKRGNDHLASVLDFLVRCWGPRHFDGYAVSGVSLFLSAFQNLEIYQEKRAIKTLSGYSYEMVQRRMRDYTGGRQAARSFALVMAQIYNSGLRTARIDESLLAGVATLE